MAEQNFLMEGEPKYKRLTGYKATNADMTCRDYQFKLGEWFEVDGDVELCENGFHFCDTLSGTWAYYGSVDARRFKIEAEMVIDLPVEPGADHKRVAKRIRFIEEVTPGSKEDSGNRNSGYGNSGNRNSGYGNSGDSNSGDSNSGYGNSGYGNSGYGNSGYGNSGNRNSGYGNSGDSNSGYGNSGNRNSGNRNSGDSNSGNRNSGDSNSGNRNSGYGNATNYSSGFFCIEEPKVISFDVQTELTRSEFESQFPENWDLRELLMQKEEIQFDRFKNIPGISRSKLEALHKKHQEIRSAKAEQELDF